MHVRVRDANEETCNLLFYYVHCAVQPIPSSPCCWQLVAILLITRPAIASHNLACFNPGINPGILGLSKLNPEIPGLAKRSGLHSLKIGLGLGLELGLGFRV